MRTIDNWELRPRALAHNWKMQGVRFFWNKFCICREQLFKFDANVGEMCKANSWNSPLNGPGSSVGSFRGGESRKEHKSQKNWGRIQISAEVDQFKGRKGGEGRERQNWILQKHFFLSLKALATEEGGENVWGLAARLLRSLGMHGVGDGARCTSYIIHCISNTAQCTLRWRCCTGAAFEWPETGLLARLWDVVHLSSTLQPLYLSTRSTLLEGAAVRGMHLALPRVETSGFGSGLDSAWTDCVWSGLIKMDCCTKFVIQTAL